MVYNIKMGIAAGAGIAGTAITTFSNKIGSSQGTSGDGTNTKYDYGSNNGCSGRPSFGSAGNGSKSGSSSKSDDTFKQMQMWKY